MPINALRLNENNDFDLTDNTINLITDEDAVIQNIKSLLNIKKGEWFINTNLGLDHSNILGKNIDINIAKLDVIETITTEENVETVDFVELTPNYENRTTLIEFAATLRTGIQINSEVVI